LPPVPDRPADTVPVALGPRSYEVRIGAGLLAKRGAEIAPLLHRARASPW
jgi:3-dehydroquinate synthase